MADIDEEILEELYGWVDSIHLSRPKKDIKRDFSDGVLVAEVIKHYFPAHVELHNYSPANKLDNKITNWKLLNRKVFKKLGFELADDVIHNVASCKPWAIEQVLMLIRRKIDLKLYEQHRSIRHRPLDGSSSDRPEADQHQRDLQDTFRKTSKQDILQSGSPRHVVKGQYPHMKDGTPYTQTEMVQKIIVEEKEQEILAKEETIQILQAKVRRLEHLLHLKDIRIDDLQSRLEHLETQLRPTAHKMVKR